MTRNVDRRIDRRRVIARSERSEHDLLLGFRCRLLRAIDELGDGRQRRTKLAILAVRKVLPIWETSFPTDDAPQQVLALVEETLTGTLIVREIAEREFNNIWSHCDELNFYRNEHSKAITVGYAAAKAGWESLSETPGGCDERITDASTDHDNDAYDSDASLDASLVYCNGGIWDEGSDNEKRLEFWTWWLTSAVRAVTLPE